jgi:hypothetical protein
VVAALVEDDPSRISEWQSFDQSCKRTEPCTACTLILNAQTSQTAARILSTRAGCEFKALQTFRMLNTAAVAFRAHNQKDKASFSQLQNWTHESVSEC